MTFKLTFTEKYVLLYQTQCKIALFLSGIGIILLSKPAKRKRKKQEKTGMRNIGNV